MYYKLNDIGQPVKVDNVLEWGAWFETADRVVAISTIGSEVKISTVFLGTDHSFGGRTPILWETLVFGGPLDGESFRYETRLQALQGHEVMRQKVRQALYELEVKDREDL